jgi:DNA-binding transcriptional LysR family regulator
VALFERGGRGLELTPTGLELLDHVRGTGDAAGRVSLAAGGRSQSVEGSIAITASAVSSAHLLPPVVARLRREYPGIVVEVVASNATVDLRRREADIAVRSVRPRQPDLIARRLRDDRARLYAAPSYLERIGNPAVPADLERADFIGFDATEVMAEGLNRLGLSVTRANFPVLCADHLVKWEMVKAGAGIGVFPETLGDAEPSVRRALPGLARMTFPI